MQQHEHIGLAAGHPRRRPARVPATLPVHSPPSAGRLDLAGLQRARIEALVERLIALLDELDGDLDLDPTADDDCCAAGDDDLGRPAHGIQGDWRPGDPDDDEASLQPPVTPDSTRPTRGGGLFA